jgi:hypothetical protein
MILILFVLIILLISINIITFYNDKYYDTYYISRISNNKVTPKVYDIGHKYLPNIEKYEYIINIILGIACIVFFMYPKIFVPFSILFMIIYIIRLFTVQLTVLPKTTCSIKSTIDLSGYCYDKIFSGHTAFLCLITLFLFNLNKISVFTLLFINILYGLLIIASRAHYTIDVFIAYIVTFSIFQNRKYFLFNQNA